MDYYKKYLKYKKKYLLLKLYNIQMGGDKALITSIKHVNLFTDSHMEQYMNPIYGLVMCNCTLFFILNYIKLFNINGFL